MALPAPRTVRARVLPTVGATIAVVVLVASCARVAERREAATRRDGATTSVAVPTTTGSAAGTPTSSAPAPAGEPLARYAGYVSIDHADDARWLCRPGRDDACGGNLDSTVVAADGTLTVQPFEPAADPAIDCFYVYPTISRDPGPVSDWDVSASEEGLAARYQAARLRSQCRVFAPVYRQRTLAALGGRAAGTATTDPYADVVDAWRTYMARDNGGRGVVVIGHSQGSAMLSRLLREEIAPNDDVRALLVGAYLAGWGVAAPSADGTGGELASVPPCAEVGQVGCLMSWASFRATAPPPAGSLFGVARPSGGRAVCTNPAAPGGGSAELHGQFPSRRGASILAAATGAAETGSSWLTGAEVTTPFVSLPGLTSGECVTEGRFGYLSVAVHGDPADPRADDVGGDLTPEWGLHLIDISLVADDIAADIGAQSAAWARAR